MFILIKRFSALTRVTGLLCLLLLFSGCSSVYYSAMEQIGVEKRDILVDRVGEAVMPKATPVKPSAHHWSGSRAW